MKLKHFTSLTLVMVTISTLIAPAAAADMAPVMPEESFIRSFDDIYNPNSLTTYTIINLDGQDITQAYIDDTKLWFTQQQYDKIYNYFFENVDSVTEIKKGRARASDITKTETRRITVNCKWTGVMDEEYTGIRNGNNNGRAAYYVRGSITYNPNTYVVSSIGIPVRTSILTKTEQQGEEHDWNEGRLRPYIINESYSKGVTGNQYGKFTYNVVIDADYEIEGTTFSTLKYGSYSTTIRINAGE